MTHSNFDCDNHELRKNLGLTITQMAVLSQITSRSWIEGTSSWCTISPEIIADFLGLTKNEVYEAMSGLIIKKYIEFPDDLGDDDCRVRCSYRICSIKLGEAQQ